MENLITNFDYKKLEFDKILNRINKYCLSLEGVNSINNTIPSNNKDKIIHEHNLVIALRKYLEKEEKLNLSIIYNFKKQIDSSNKGITLNEIQLYELAFSVKEYFYIKKRLFIEGYEIFHSLFKVDKLEDDFYIDILKYIDHDGNIDSKASSELKNIRSGIIEINNRIHKSANEYLRKYKEQGYVSDEIISIREGLLCIAVKSSYKIELMV